MKYLTEKQLIKQWAKQVKQSCYLTESTSTWSDIIDDIKERFDKGVEDNNYIYFIALDRFDGQNSDIEDYAVFLTADNVDELFKSTKFYYSAIECINHYITNDKDLCDKFKITYHGDSSYDEDEIQEKSEELYYEAFYGLEDDLEDELNRIPKDPRKKDRNGLKGNVFATVLGRGDTVYTPYSLVFGITNYKQHVGKLMSGGKIVQI